MISTPVRCGARCPISRLNLLSAFHEFSCGIRWLEISAALNPCSARTDTAGRSRRSASEGPQTALWTAFSTSGSDCLDKLTLRWLETLSARRSSVQTAATQLVHSQTSRSNPAFVLVSGGVVKRDVPLRRPTRGMELDWDITACILSGRAAPVLVLETSVRLSWRARSGQRLLAFLMKLRRSCLLHQLLHLLLRNSH